MDNCKVSAKYDEAENNIVRTRTHSPKYKTDITMNEYHNNGDQQEQ